MREIVIKSVNDEIILQQLADCLGGDVQQKWGEHTLNFTNGIGEGTIRHVAFDWGVSLMDCDIQLQEELKITFRTSQISPVEFIFITAGSLQYSEDEMKQLLELQRYQNIIISPKRHSKKTFIFPAKEQIKVNFIRIQKKEFLKKKNNNITYLNDLLLSVFRDENSDLPYAHSGSFSLKIADQVKALSNVYDSGIIRTLSLEGRLYLILSMQLIEHHNFEEQKMLPESLSKEDIRKIHILTEYIVNNISEPLSIKLLSQESSLSPKKLQLGFRLLYSKSVNEYVRQIKLEIARDYLKNSEMSISEIVYLVGIKSRSYFSKIFMENYGILPTQYRKKLKNPKL